MANAIWSLKNESGIEESSFAGMTRVEKNHFSDLFKAQESISIAEIVRIAQYFSHFVNEEDNEELMVAISKEELKETLQSFQKDKSLCPDELPVEFYLDLFNLIG